MACCNDPYDLGCITACQGVYTNISADCAGTYTLHFEHNGAIIQREIISNGSGGFLVIPGNTFNESSQTIFSVWDGNTLIGCYKVKVNPVQPGIFDSPDSWGTITSSITLTSLGCAPGQGGLSVWGITGVLTLNDINYINNGTTIDLDFSYPNSSGITAITLQSLESGVSATGFTFSIDDKSQITGNTISFRADVTLAACIPSMGIQAIVSCYSNLPVGILVGTQQISNTI